MKNQIRKIIHIDMDAFFAAVEIRDHPEYKGKPIIVGGSPTKRGVVSTCSYEARKYGIRSAMASALAIKLCPHAIFVRGRFEAYREASQQINQIFQEFTEQIEPVSIDEAYLDVTNNMQNFKSATEIARKIKQKIFEITKLTASAGVSYNKFIAKIASDFDKPDGLVVIPPNQAEKFLNALPIRKFHGIGKVSEKKMKSLGIFTGKDLREVELKDLLKNFGKVGRFYYNVVRGIDEREVKIHHVRKSIGNEKTFVKDIDDPVQLRDFLKTSAHKIALKLKEKGAKARTLTLKIKYANFDIVTKRKTIQTPINDEMIILHIAENLLLQNIQDKRLIRLLGISVSNLVWKNERISEQLLFPFHKDYPIFNIDDEDFF
ncbi:MAG: DNA polymerase IV [Candidatus Cloacimonetes bacterium]|nr:DNA polymerase IV [Candidatus Cloacimonadota bacterium]